MYVYRCPASSGHVERTERGALRPYVIAAAVMGDDPDYERRIRVTGSARSVPDIALGRAAHAHATPKYVVPTKPTSYLVTNQRDFNRKQ